MLFFFFLKVSLGGFTTKLCFCWTFGKFFVEKIVIVIWQKCPCVRLLFLEYNNDVMERQQTKMDWSWRNMVRHEVSFLIQLMIRSYNSYMCTIFFCSHIMYYVRPHFFIEPYHLLFGDNFRINITTTNYHLNEPLVERYRHSHPTYFGCLHIHSDWFNPTSTLFVDIMEMSISLSIY